MEGLFKVKDTDFYEAELGSVLIKLECTKQPGSVIRILKVALRKEACQLMNPEELFQKAGKRSRGFLFHIILCIIQKV